MATGLEMFSPEAISMVFAEMFGFKPAEEGSVAFRAQELIVSAFLENLARAVTGRQQTLQEVRGRLREGSEDSASVASFAQGMAKLENQVAEAQREFDTAVDLAKSVGFAVMGCVEDSEVKRIFGLDHYHRPLTKTEEATVDNKMMFIVASRRVAHFNRNTFSAPQRPTSEDQRHEEELRKAADEWEAKLKEAEGLAVKVLEVSKEEMRQKYNDALKHCTIGDFRSVIERCRS